MHKDSTQIQNSLPSPEAALTEVVNRSFETSPDTVYGVLVGLLVIMLIGLCWYVYNLHKKLVELNISTIEVLKDLNTSLQLIKEESDNHSSKLIDHISHTREHISEKINHLQNRISST